MAKVGFTIQGEFITDTARGWYWLEGRQKEAIELIMSATMTDQLTYAERQKMAMDILEYRKQIVGRSGTDEYNVIEDSRTASREEINAKRKYDLENKRQSFENVDGEYFGFFDKKAKWHPVIWSGHRAYATEVLEDNEPLYKRWREAAHKEERYLSALDFLILHVGWIMVHNPFHGRPNAKYVDEKITKRQRETLYDFFMTIEEPERAENVIKDNRHHYHRTL